MVSPCLFICSLMYYKKCALQAGKELVIMTSLVCVYQGSHPTWKTWKTWNFVMLFSRPGKCLAFAQKVVKALNFKLKTWKNLKFSNSMFQTSLFKMSFNKNNSDLLLCHIYIININTDLKPN